MFTRALQIATVVAVAAASVLPAAAQPAADARTWSDRSLAIEITAPEGWSLLTGERVKKMDSAALAAFAGPADAVSAVVLKAEGDGAEAAAAWFAQREATRTGLACALGTAETVTANRRSYTVYPAELIGRDGGLPMRLVIPSRKGATVIVVVRGAGIAEAVTALLPGIAAADVTPVAAWQVFDAPDRKVRLALPPDWKGALGRDAMTYGADAAIGFTGTLPASGDAKAAAISGFVRVWPVTDPAKSLAAVAKEIEAEWNALLGARTRTSAYEVHADGNAAYRVVLDYTGKLTPNAAYTAIWILQRRTDTYAALNIATDTSAAGHTLVADLIREFRAAGALAADPAMPKTTGRIGKRADMGDGSTILLDSPTWGADSRIIARPKVGDPVTVLQKQDAFTKVRLANGVEGWMSAGDIELDPPGTTTPAPAETTTRIAKTADMGDGTTILLDRATFGSESKVVGRPRVGTVVTVLQRDGRFAQVRLPDGTTGYLVASDLEEVAKTPDEPVTPPAAVRTGTVRAAADVGNGTTVMLDRPDWINGKVIARPRVGAKVTIHSAKRRFLEVSLEDGTRGWVTPSDIEATTLPEAGAGAPYETTIAKNADMGGGTTLLLDKPTWNQASRIVARPKVGETVTVLETGKDFSRVRLASGTEGWIATGDLTPRTSGGTAPAPAFQEYDATILARADMGDGTTIVLSEPTFAAGSQIVARPKIGERVRVTGTKDTFLQVRLASGVAGWMDARDLSK